VDVVVGKSTTILRLPRKIEGDPHTKSECCKIILELLVAESTEPTGESDVEAVVVKQF
jgi:hypothetical protein